jgi:hypothetical protein
MRCLTPYLSNHNVVFLGASTQVECHRAMVVRSPIVRTLPAPVLGLFPGQGLSTALPVGTPIIPTPSVLVRVSKTRKPVAGGKALSTPRQRSQGECEIVASLGRGVNGVVASHVVEQDVFVIKIPNSKEEYFIPGKYVRSSSTAISEVTKSYANLLNVSDDELRVVEMDLTTQFAAIRLEFSEAHFREEVLASATGFEFSADVCSRDTLAYKTAGNSVAVLVDNIQRSNAHDRFYQERCDAIFRDDPEYDRLSSLATEGVIIDKPEELILQSFPGPPHKLQ